MSKVVAVSGGFDPLHRGHIEYLKEAKKLGDKLVVILNKDQFLLKEKGSIFMPYEDRREILKALGFVDDVILLFADFHFVISVFGKHDRVADFHSNRNKFVIISALSWTDSYDLSALWLLFLRRVGNDDSGRRFLIRIFFRFHQNPIRQGLDFNVFIGLFFHKTNILKAYNIKWGLLYKLEALCQPQRNLIS